MGTCNARCGSENCVSAKPAVADPSISEVRRELADVLDPPEPCESTKSKEVPKTPFNTAVKTSEEGSKGTKGAEESDKGEAMTYRPAAVTRRPKDAKDAPKKRASSDSNDSGLTATVRNSACDSASSSSPGSDDSCDSDTSSIFSAFRPNRRRKEMRLLITHTMGLNPSAALGLIIENSDTIDKHYRLDTVLGQGAFGVVKKAELIATKACRAAKIVSKDRIKESKHAFKKEIEIMKMVDHPNLLMLYEIFEDDENMYLIMQLCSGGHLLGQLKKLGKFSEAQSAHVMRQILRGVCYLHRRDICHRDLKAENCLFTLVAPVEKNHLKIADFGLSRILEKGSSFKQMAGTVTHMSPEVLARKYNLACDLWACGVILFELLSGQLPFRGHTFEEIEKLVLKTQPSYESAAWLHLPQKAIDYTSRFLCRSVRRRITAKEALNDPWLLANAPALHKIQLHGRALLNVVKFRSLSRLKRAVLHVMGSMVPDSEVDKARQFFLMVDVDCDGMISFNEIKGHLDFKTCTQAEKDIPADMEDLSYTEFIAATLDRKKNLKSSVFKAVFSSFDKNGDGNISISELSTGKLLGHLSPGEVMDEMEQVDLDGDLTLNFKEFKKMMLASKSALNLDVDE